MSQLCDTEAEAAETRVWIEFAVQGGHLESETGQELLDSYENNRGKIVSLMNPSAALVIARREMPLTDVEFICSPQPRISSSPNDSLLE